jgi:hypothetical protein
MKRLFVGAMVLAIGIIPAAAQSLEDLNIQIHGYATQGFLYTTNNNILTTTSSNGSPAWTEAVVNVSSHPTPKLRIAVQARYELLGNYSNTITLDWAAADYKANDLFGVRFGKVKVPSGLFNETQDIDPSYLWGLLPQSVYPISSRNSQLSEYGGVFYGTVKLSPNLGKLEYRGWGGEVVLGSNDGYFTALTEEGFNFTNGLTGSANGGTLIWKTPLSGLTIGASDNKRESLRGPFTSSNGPGSAVVRGFNEPDYFAHFEKNKLMVAGEYTRLGSSLLFDYAIGYVYPFVFDDRAWYGMATYKLTGKLTAGVYDSQLINHASPLGPARYSKDWTFSGRYDFNQFLYAKAEEHLIEGTAVGYDADLNPGGLTPNTKLTILKVGVSF